MNQAQRTANSKLAEQKIFELYKNKSFDGAIDTQNETLSINELILMSPNTSCIFKTFDQEVNQFYQVKTTALNEDGITTMI
jgi:hypothetical protein